MCVCVCKVETLLKCPFVTVQISITLIPSVTAKCGEPLGSGKTAVKYLLEAVLIVTSSLVLPLITVNCPAKHK